MKKLSISLLVMLLIASLFTSCSMGSDDASDVRVKVKITPSGGGRSLTTDFETINLDDDSITWHYSATKVSETQFNYGATSGSLLPKDGIVTLSQGQWKIKLWAYKDSKKVYDSDESNVTIKWNFYEPNVTVTVPVKQNTGDNGFIVLNNVTIPNGTSNVPPNYIYIDETKIINYPEPYLRLECAPGSHTITFEYRSDENTVVSKKSVVVNVISGRETTISGNIEESEITSGGSSGPTSEVQAIEVKKETEVEVKSSVVPASTSTSETKTTVTFPAGSFNADSANAVLNLSVKSAGEITVTSTEVPAVAGIDISLKVNNQEVNSFNGKEVVIETYIDKNLTNVIVRYNGDGDQPIATDENVDDRSKAKVLDTDEGSSLGYNPNTGLLRFKTNHFSEYYVLANVEALNVSTGIPYTKLATAIEDVDDEQIVKLLSNVSINSISIPNKNFTIDLNSKTIETKYGLYLNKSDSKYVLSVKNGTIKSSIGHAFSMYQSSGLIIDNMYVEAAYGGVYLSETNNNMSVRVINGSKIKAAVYGIATNASKVESKDLYIEVKDSIVETSSEDQDNTGILFNVQGKVYIENSTIKGNRQGMILRGGTNSVIKNSTIEATGTKTSGYDWTDNMTNDWGQGNQVPLASLVVGNHISNNSYPYPVSVKLENATIKFSENRSGIYIYKTANYDVVVDGTIAGTTIINSGKNGATCNIEYNISTDEELIQFAKMVNDCGYTFNGETVKLTADINLAGIEWTPIGTNADRDNKFQGTFNGQGHTISNMTVKQDADYHAAGFFGALNGTAKNIVFDNASVSSISSPNSEGNTDNGTAIVAGSIYTFGSIESVTVKNSTVSGNRYVGGISGYTYGSVKNCTVENTTITSIPDKLTGNYDNGDKAGGVVGAFWHENTYEISGNTVSDVTVTGYRDIGGIVGFANGNVTRNTVNGLTLIQDYSKIEESKSTLEAIVGRHDNFEVDTSNESTDVTIKVEVETLDQFKSAIHYNSSIIIIKDNIELEEAISISGDGITLTGDGTSTISGYPIWISSAEDKPVTIKFDKVNFATPDNNNDNASCVYASSLYGKVEFTNCKFTNPQWECIQITPMDGAEIVVTDCTFEADGTGTYAHGTKVERLLHIQNTDATGKFTAVITNNNFIGVDLCRNAVIDVDDIDAFAYVTCGGNTFASHDGTPVSTLEDGMIYININGKYDAANVATNTYAQFTQTPAAPLKH